MIDSIDIEKRKEDNQLEAKAGKGGVPDSMWETYSAFANTDGGIILLGVKERDSHSLEIVGLEDAYKMKSDIWNMLNNRQKISVNLLTERRVRIENINGKDIIVVDIPRAERSARPVYKGLDPRTGTYRRNGEGDYLCSLEEVSAMFRDAAITTQDSKILTEMSLDVFCQDTIKAYRQVFKATHGNHPWNHLEDELFLRHIGAIALDVEGGKYHPTAAGLLMFGYEYEITREFPQYFLDYQQNRQASSVRWTDRLVSSSGEWSGNVFDFVLNVVPKLTFDLKKPFVLHGMQRIDDTPVHKALREATTNSCVHADFYGRQGVVIQKQPDGFRFANPGGLRIAKSSAIEGGVSDPRNGVMLKMFSLIDYGERAGSGLSTICHVWSKVFHQEAELIEQTGVDRVILHLPGRPEDEDINAMLQFYDDPDELTILGYMSHSSTATKGEQEVNEGERGVNEGERQNAIDGLKPTERKVYELLKGNPCLSITDLAETLGISRKTVHKYTSHLQSLKLIKHDGPNFGGQWLIL